MARILVVDDDPYLRDLLVRFLTLEGYHVETAVDGHRALAMIADSPPDLLITDLAMPQLTGWDVFIRARTQVPHVPIIVITAISRGLLGDETALPLPDAFLPKPFDLDHLLETVTRLLDKSQVAVSPAS